MQSVFMGKSMVERLNDSGQNPMDAVYLIVKFTMDHMFLISKKSIRY